MGVLQHENIYISPLCNFILSLSVSNYKLTLNMLSVR